MTSIYINYPNSHFSIRTSQAAAERCRHDKPNRRLISISPANITEALGPFIAGEVRFASDSALNDLWLEIDFGDEPFERHLAEYIQRLLGKRYKPLADAPWL